MSTPKIICTRTTIPAAGALAAMTPAPESLTASASQTVSHFATAEEAVASIKALGPEIKSPVVESVKACAVDSTVVHCPTNSTGGIAGSTITDKSYWEEYKVVSVSYWTGAVKEPRLVAVHHFNQLPTTSKTYHSLPEVDPIKIFESAMARDEYVILAGQAASTLAAVESKSVASPAQSTKVIMDSATPSVTDATAQAALTEVKKIYAIKINLSWFEFCLIHDMVCNFMGNWERGELKRFIAAECNKDHTRSDLICLMGYIMFRCDKDYIQALGKLSHAASMGSLLAMKNLIDMCSETGMMPPGGDGHLAIYQAALDETKYCSPDPIASLVTMAKLDPAFVTASAPRSTASEAALEEVKKVYATKTDLSYAEVNRIDNLIVSTMSNWERGKLIYFIAAECNKDHTRSDLIRLMGYIMFRCDKDYTQALGKLARAASMGNLMAMKDMIYFDDVIGCKLDEELIAKYKAALTEANYCK
jgi:hypothetical protein